MNLGRKISNNSVSLKISEAIGQQGQQSNGISTLSNSNRIFGDFSNKRCITPSGQFENWNVNCDDEEKNENNRINFRLCIYNPHDILSLDRERSIPDSYNKIIIDDLMMDDPRQKISLVKLQLLCIVSGYHDVYGSSKGQSGYT